MVEDKHDSTVFLVEDGVEYSRFIDYFDLDDDDLSEPRVLETTDDGQDATLVSYAVDDGLENHSDARLDFRVYDASNELHKAEAVLTDYDEDGKIASTKTYTFRNGRVTEALYD